MRGRQIPVGCVQLAAIDRQDFDERWEHVLARTESAAVRGARLIVLPEGTVPAYVLGRQAVCEEQLLRARDDLASIARRFGATLVYGGVKIVGNQTFNAAIALGPQGHELGFAAKQFLWHFDRQWFMPGRTLEPVDTPVGRLGLLVCADGRIPTIAATLVERGAEVLVMPTAWVTSGRDPSSLENIQADLMVNVRARENGVPFLASNKAGVELGTVAYCGKSTIVDADGATRARAGERDEETLVDDIVVGGRGRVSVARLADTSLNGPGERAQSRQRVRVGFTLEREPSELSRLAAFGATADMDVILVLGPSSPSPGLHGACSQDGRAPVVVLPADGSGGGMTFQAEGLSIAFVGDDILSNPRGLIDVRQRGVDLIVWHAHVEPAWQIRFARTRAAELRAYVVVFDAHMHRSFAVDPDGIVIAGTFEAYRLASFLYERARSLATLVAPATDVAAGLRIAEQIRGEGLAAPRTD